MCGCVANLPSWCCDRLAIMNFMHMQWVRVGARVWVGAMNITGGCIARIRADHGRAPVNEPTMQGRTDQPPGCSSFCIRCNRASREQGWRRGLHLPGLGRLGRRRWRDVLAHGIQGSTNAGF